MSQSVPCPGCEAQLALPSLPAGQTVQCPRCQRVFDPGKPRAQPSPASPFAADLVIFPGATSEAADSHLGGLRFDTNERDLRPPRGEWKANVAMLFVAASVLTYGLQFCLSIEHLLLIDAQDRLVGGPRLPHEIPIGKAAWLNLDRQWRLWESYVEAVKALHHLTFWPSAFFVLLWIFRAAANAPHLLAEQIGHSPFEAVIAFFVPILNFYRPYAIVQEIWRTSDPHAITGAAAWIGAPVSRVVQVWWTLHVIGALIQFRTFLVETVDLNPPINDPTMAMSSLLSSLVIIAEGICLILVIHSIKRRQRERYENLCDAAA